MANAKPQTIKKSKSVYIVGSLTVGIVVLLAVYFILIATGVISAAPEHIVLATASRSVEYDGEALVANEWWIDGGKLKSDHKISVTVTGRQTDVGVGKNTVEYKITDDRGYDVTDSYDVELSLGELEVTPRSLVVSSASAEKQYDGTPLVNHDCKIERGTLAGKQHIEYFVNGSLTAAGKADNNFIALIYDGNTDVTGNYALEYLYGTLYVHGELIEISTPSAEKVYDGKPLTANDYSITSGGPLAGDTLSVTVTGSQTEVGSSDNKASFSARSSSGADVTAKYEAVFTFGQLTVTPVKILIETKSDYKIYDGMPLVADGWRVVSDSTLKENVWYTSGDTCEYNGFTVTADVIGSLTDCGVAENTAVFASVTRDGEDMTSTVEVEYKFGSLTVLPRPIAVQSGDKHKQFDGTPLTYDYWEVVKGVYNVADGQTIRVTVSGSITYVGMTANTIAEVVIFDKDGRDVTNNYTVKLQEGQLMVYGEGQYEGGNGKPEGQGDGTSEEKGSSDGDGDGEGDGENSGGDGNLKDDGGLGGGSGDSENNVLVMQVKTDINTLMYLRYMSYGDYNYSGFDPAEDYSGAVYQTVNEVTNAVRNSFGMNYLSGLMLSSAGKTYNTADIKLINTTQYFLPYYQTTDEFICAAQSSDVKYAGDDKDYKVNYYDYDYAADYGVTLNNAKLTRYAAIEKAYREFVYSHYLSVPSDTLEYLNGVIDMQGLRSLDGGTLVAAVASYIQSAAVYNAKYDRTLDGESDVVVSFLRDYNEGVCRHYSAAATLMYRALGIPARYCIGYAVNTIAGEWVDVMSADCAHAWTEVYIDGLGWYRIEVTGGGAGDGNGNNGFGDPDSDHTLNIKPFDLNIDNKDYRLEYNGQPFVYNSQRLQGLTELEDNGYSYKFVVLGAISEAGMTTTTITAFTLFDPCGNDVTDNFNIKAQQGTLQIYIEALTVKTESRSKIYDGVPLLPDGDNDYSVSGNLLGNHKIFTVAMTGAQRNVGLSSNTCKIVITDGDGNVANDIYLIKYEYGTLEVKPRAIVITTGSAVGYLTELNGQALTCSEYTVTSEDGEAMIEGDELTVTINGYRLSVGQSDNTVESVSITSANGDSALHNYSIIYEYGTLTVLPFRYNVA